MSYTSQLSGHLADASEKIASMKAELKTKDAELTRLRSLNAEYLNAIRASLPLVASHPHESAGKRLVLLEALLARANGGGSHG